jgi:hypothetical protein
MAKRATTAKRKDGKPTRADKRKVNKSEFAKARKDYSLYLPPNAHLRYASIIDQVRSGELKTDDDIQQAVLTLIVAGCGLRVAREAVGVTHYQWHVWLRDNEDLHKQYLKAKDDRSESWADDIMEDAEGANAFNVQALRLRIDTKKWLMGKNSGRYADRVVVAGDPGAPLQTVTREMTAEEAQEAYQAMKKNAG